MLQSRNIKHHTPNTKHQNVNPFIKLLSPICWVLNRPWSSLSLPSPPAWLLLPHQHVFWQPSSMASSDTLLIDADIHLSTEDNPADVALLCGAHSSDVQAQIKKLCGNDVEAALSAYRDTCKAAGKTISTSNFVNAFSGKWIANMI